MAKVVKEEYDESTEEYVYTIELEDWEEALLVEKYGTRYEEILNENIIKYIREEIENETVPSCED